MEEKCEKLIEMFQQYTDEQKRLNQSLAENLSKKMDEIIENLSKKMDDMVTENRNDSKLFREEIRKEKTEEIKYDSKPETEEIPSEKPDVYKRQAL